MQEDVCTKDVFREMDGFLVLMSVLSTIQPTHSWAVASSGDMIVHEVLEAVRLIFAIISEAMDEHKQNTLFFEVCYALLYVSFDPQCPYRAPNSALWALNPWPSPLSRSSRI